MATSALDRILKAAETGNVRAALADDIDTTMADLNERLDRLETLRDALDHAHSSIEEWAACEERGERADLRDCAQEALDVVGSEFEDGLGIFNRDELAMLLGPL